MAGPLTAANGRTTGSRGRRWCWTSFTPEDPPNWDESWCQYILWGHETCPETGRQHLQGYLETNKKMTWTAVKAALGQPALHLEKAIGSQEDNVVYCCKEGEWVEFGTPIAQGQRGDLTALASEVFSGTASVADVLEDQPHAFHVYGRTLLAIEDLRLQRMTRGMWAPPTVTWIWGPTGTGKSRRAWEQASSDGLDQLYAHTTMDKGWWDLYQGQENVLLEDFRGCIPFNELLRLLDGYPVNVPRRGRAPVPFMAKRIWVTSSKAPDQIYTSDSVRENINQLLRRITEIIDTTP